MVGDIVVSVPTDVISFSNIVKDTVALQPAGEVIITLTSSRSSTVPATAVKVDVVDGPNTRKPST